MSALNEGSGLKRDEPDAPVWTEARAEMRAELLAAPHDPIIPRIDQKQMPALLPS